jgi:hypothetical protein
MQNTYPMNQTPQCTCCCCTSNNQYNGTNTNKTSIIEQVANAVEYTTQGAYITGVVIGEHVSDGMIDIMTSSLGLIAIPTGAITRTYRKWENNEMGSMEDWMVSAMDMGGENTFKITGSAIGGTALSAVGPVGTVAGVVGGQFIGGMVYNYGIVPFLSSSSNEHKVKSL